MVCTLARLIKPGPIAMRAAVIRGTHQAANKKMGLIKLGRVL